MIKASATWPSSSPGHSEPPNNLFFRSDHGADRGAQLYGLIGSCRLNSIDPEDYLHHVLSVIAD